MNRALLTILAALLALPLLAADRRRAVVPPVSEEGLSFDQWIARRAIPFSTTEPVDDDADLLPLLSLAGNCSYAGVGEATHGSHEFFTMKHRMFRFLAERLGFTVFSMEANLPDCDRINDYVHGGDGDIGVLALNLHFLWWRTDEVIDLIEWMRNYNLTHPDRPQLSFRGFDMQYSQVAVSEVLGYIARVDPARAGFVTSQLDCVNVSYTAYQSLPAARRNACHDDVIATYDSITKARDAYTAASSVAEYERILRYARVIVQFEDVAGHSTNPYSRDAAMAENAIWIAEIEHPHEKMMLWAHNNHIGTYGSQMGAYLRDRWPEAYVAFGFAFDHGDFNATDTRTGAIGPQHVDPANDDGYETYFRRTTRPRFFLDLRNPPRSVHDDLFVPKPMYDIGGGYPVPRLSIAAGKQWDVIIWVEESTPSHLRWR